MSNPNTDPGAASSPEGSTHYFLIGEGGKTISYVQHVTPGELPLVSRIDLAPNAEAITSQALPTAETPRQIAVFEDNGNGHPRVVRHSFGKAKPWPDPLPTLAILEIGESTDDEQPSSSRNIHPTVFAGDSEELYATIHEAAIRAAQGAEDGSAQQSPGSNEAAQADPSAPRRTPGPHSSGGRLPARSLSQTSYNIQTGEPLTRGEQSTNTYPPAASSPEALADNTLQPAQGNRPTHVQPYTTRREKYGPEKTARREVVSAARQRAAVAAGAIIFAAIASPVVTQSVLAAENSNSVSAPSEHIPHTPRTHLEPVYEEHRLPGRTLAAGVGSAKIDVEAVRNYITDLATQASATDAATVQIIYRGGASSEYGDKIYPSRAANMAGPNGQLARRRNEAVKQALEQALHEQHISAQLTSAGLDLDPPDKLDELAKEAQLNGFPSLTDAVDYVDNGGTITPARKRFLNKIVDNFQKARGGSFTAKFRVFKEFRAVPNAIEYVRPEPAPSQHRGRWWPLLVLAPLGRRWRRTNDPLRVSTLKQ